MKVFHPASLPQYASFEFPTYTFAPKLASDLGVVTIKGVLYNSHGEFKYEFKVIVENEAPYLKEAPNYLKVLIGNKTTIALVPQDKEGDVVMIKTFEEGKKSLPTFI